MGDVTPVGHVSRSLAALGLTITWTPSGSSAREGHTWRVSRYQRSRGAKGPGLPVSPIATAQRIVVVGRRSNASCLARRSAAGRSRPSHGGIGVSAFAESPQSCLTCCSPRSSKSSDSLLQQPVRFSGFACAAPDRCEAGRQMRVSFGGAPAPLCPLSAVHRIPGERNHGRARNACPERRRAARAAGAPDGLPRWPPRRCTMLPSRIVCVSA